VTVRTRLWTPLTGSVAIIVLVVGSLLVSATQARADLYRYWSVWQQDNAQWTFVETAPDSINPGDGSVMGWRFGAGGVDGSTTRPPRANPTFADICGDVVAPASQKAVGLVVDTGTATDSPDGSTPPSPIFTCAVLPEDANAVQVLQWATDTRIEGGLVCAVLEYPATGCGDTIAGASGTPTDTAEDLAVSFTATEPLSSSGVVAGATEPAVIAEEGTSSPSGLLILAGIAGVLAIASVAVALARRNRDLGHMERSADPDNHRTPGVEDNRI
jgi:hypothetical protein